MRGVMLAAAVAAMFAGCATDGGDIEASKPRRIPSMTMEEVASGIAANQVVAVDCNGPLTRKKYGTLPGAILIEDADEFAPSVLPANKQTKLVFYCWDMG
jgi:hypothetical protein